MRRPDLVLRRVDREGDLELLVGRAGWWWRPWKWRLIERSAGCLVNACEGRAWRRSTAVAHGRHFRSVLRVAGNRQTQESQP